MLRPWLEALRRRATARAAEDKRWRSERDFARRASAWIAVATTAMLEPMALEALLATPMDTREDEAFYLRAALHGYRLVGKRSLEVALRDAAVRMLVARALLALFATLPDGELDPACAYPLALVESTLRGHGLDVYVDDVAG
jgi:lysine-N-methylase